MGEIGSPTETKEVIMSVNANFVSIRYRADESPKTRIYRLPNNRVRLSKEEAYAAIGRIVYAAHRDGVKLAYIHIVPCVKRPGTKVCFDMSRTSMSERQLRHWCKYFHKAAFGC
jgi:hypothetical protein